MVARLKLALKRAYEPAVDEDGERFLVERLWPRGVTREAAHLTGWLKDLAPSDALRRWFGHAPARWPEFQRRYEEELAGPDKQPLLHDLAERAKRGPVTLVYAARDTEHNGALVLKRFLEHRVRPGVPRR